jgi:hypothetical protein
MNIGLLTLQVSFPGCKSLKEKRSRLKPLIARLHREFNISIAEISHNDIRDKAMIGCVLISNESEYTQKALQSIIHWLEVYWPDITLEDDHIEILT